MTRCANGEDTVDSSTMTEPWHDAAEIVGDRHHTRRLVITCEHASNAVPEPLKANDADQAWLDSHWGWDIGAAQLTRELVARKSCCAVLARFSRLSCSHPLAPEPRRYSLAIQPR